MNRRELLLKICGITGIPVGLGACSMGAIRLAEGRMGDRMRHPGIGLQFSGLPVVVKIIVLANYPATPHQAQVAEKRARTAVSTIARREGKKARVSSPAAEDKPAPAISMEPPTASEAMIAASALQQEAGTFIIAVDTTPDTRLQGTRAVMLWNTKTESLVENNVYDTSSPPAKNQVAQWGDTTARYVGSSL